MPEISPTWKRLGGLQFKAKMLMRTPRKAECDGITCHSSYVEGISRMNQPGQKHKTLPEK
jgi:hypothetical protein